MGKKTTAAAPPESPVDGYVQALRAELEGYVRYGNEERAADVRAELQRAGGGTPRGASSTPPSNTAATTPTVTR